MRDCISERWCESQKVRDAITRLASHGKVKVHEVQSVALDVTSENDLRVDAVTLILAMREGRRSLSRLLDSGDNFVVIETLKRLRELRTDWATPEIISRVKNSSEPSKRAIFAWALAGYSHSVEALQVLLETIKADPDVDVRNHAIESLSAFRSSRVVDFLLNILEHGSASERFWSLYSLGTIGDARVVQAISKYLKDETQIPHFGTISAEAKWALDKITKPREAEEE